VIVVDSCGWIEVFANGPLASLFDPYLQDLRSVVTPTVVVYEVYRKLNQAMSEDDALSALTVLQQTTVVPLSTEIALNAADLAIQHQLSMADAFVLATGYEMDADIVTSDRSFEGLPRVVYFSKTA
jgi:predicted nucleic acid-binding protein